MKHIRTKEDIDRFFSENGETHDIYLVGAGYYGRAIGYYLNKNNWAWCGYIDKREITGKINGKRVESYSSIFPDNSYFLCSVGMSTTPYIIRQLEKKQITEDRIIVIDSYDNNLIYELSVDRNEFTGEVEEIKKLRDIHKNERCFLIGNGPSLCVEDLDKLKNETTFACNSIYALFPYTEWRPTYYVATDTIQTEILSRERIIGEISQQVKSCFLSFSAFEKINKHFDENNRIRFLNCVWGVLKKDNVLKVRLSDEIDKRVYTVGTVMYVMMQIALYMGFSEIYLLGVDMSFSVEQKANGEMKNNDVVDHQDIIEQEEKRFSIPLLKERFGLQYLGLIDNQIAAYSMANEYAKKNSIKIYNATRGGKLEVFERVNFDTIF